MPSACCSGIGVSLWDRKEKADAAAVSGSTCAHAVAQHIDHHGDSAALVAAKGTPSRGLGHGSKGAPRLPGDTVTRNKDTCSPERHRVQQHIDDSVLWSRAACAGCRFSSFLSVLLQATAGRHHTSV